MHITRRSLLLGQPMHITRSSLLLGQQAAPPRHPQAPLPLCLRVTLRVQATWVTAPPPPPLPSWWVQTDAMETSESKAAAGIRGPGPPDQDSVCTRFDVQAITEQYH